MSDLRVPDLNKVFLAGRLTRDPELRYTTSGVAMVKIGLAVTRYYRTSDGERKEDVVFVNVTAWERMAEYVGEAFKKGRPILVEGRLTLNEWEDKNTGQKRSVIEVRADRIQALDWDEQGGGSRSGGGGRSDSAQGGGPDRPRPEPRKIEEPIAEDDIPF